MQIWRDWVVEAVDMMDGDGTFRHFPCAGARRQQPAYDMEVLRVVRGKWCELRNDDMKRQFDAKKSRPG